VYKEKLRQIFEKMADMTLEMLDKSKGNVLYLDGDELEMVRTTQYLYETLNHANQPVIATASFLDDKDVSENGCRYTSRPDEEFSPTDSSGAKYSPLSSSTVRPKASHECCQ